MSWDMNRVLRCWMAAGALLVVGCGGEEPGTPAPTGIESQVNPLEASGMVEFFVRVVGTRTGTIRGEATTRGFEGTIPGIRYYSELNSPTPTGRLQCTTFRFTEAAGIASPLLARAISCFSAPCPRPPPPPASPAPPPPPPPPQPPPPSCGMRSRGPRKYCIGE